MQLKRARGQFVSLLAELTAKGRTVLMRNYLHAVGLDVHAFASRKYPTQTCEEAICFTSNMKFGRADPEGEDNLYS